MFQPVCTAKGGFDDLFIAHPFAGLGHSGARSQQQQRQQWNLEFGSGDDGQREHVNDKYDGVE